MNPSRRRALALLCLAALPGSERFARAAAPDANDNARELLRAGDGLVVVMRHALAPGTFDPPGFRPGVCSTQRNLSDDGRAQAQRIGAWYRAAGLVPVAVRSSAWCRCLDTARGAFGTVELWPPLDSVISGREREPAQTAQLRQELRRLQAAGAPGFQVWVTHQANITALTGSYTDSGAGVLLRHDAAGNAPAVLATLQIA